MRGEGNINFSIPRGERSGQGQAHISKVCVKAWLTRVASVLQQVANAELVTRGHFRWRLLIGPAHFSGFLLAKILWSKNHFDSRIEFIIAAAAARISIAIFTLGNYSAVRERRGMTQTYFTGCSLQHLCCIHSAVNISHVISSPVWNHQKSQISCPLIGQWLAVRASDWSKLPGRINEVRITWSCGKWVWV